MHDRTQHRRSLRLDLELDLDLADASYSLHRVDNAPFAARARKVPSAPEQPHTASSSGLAASEAEDLDDILLRAIEPPDHTRLSLDDTLRQMKFTSRKKHCFKQLLTRVEMSLWTLHFQRREYERAYCAYLYEHAVARVRYALSIALVFVLLKTGYERVNLERDSPGALHDEWVLVLQLHAFVAVPVLAAVLLCTLVRRLDGLCELYGALPFVVVTYVLTAQKILLGSKGPVFALFLVFVPVFGITRFRFLTSVVLVALMFSGHVGGLLLFQHAETATDVLFQAYNYFGGIVVGAVCHYRAEVLRRRNFVMLLPFCDEPLDAPRLHRKLHDPRLKKHALMARATLKFRNPVVEDTFYRHWYLIDPCPFDHPNAGELHRNVYRSVRFAVCGVIFAQLMLVVQDWEYLYADSAFPYTAYVLATCLRFTIVIPAYGISPFIMLFCGTRFYWQWREQAATQGRGAMRSSSMRSMRSESSRCTSLEASQVSAVSVSEAEASTASYVALRSPAERVRNHQDYDLEANADPNAPLFRNNYVRFLQCLSTVVVFCHALAMGVILLLVDQLASQHNASAAPCYFLGFLNALLFPHRSGFRVRFVYAAVATVCVGVLFVAAGLAVDNNKVLTYASYMALANILGMMVSHEEESLRRIFFVRMMLRTDEFRRRHDAILTLEPWFKSLFRARRRRKRQQNAVADPCFSRSASFYQSLKIPTVNQMVQASKVGMSLELGRAAIALLTELV